MLTARETLKAHQVVWFLFTNVLTLLLKSLNPRRAQNRVRKGETATNGSGDSTKGVADWTHPSQSGGESGYFAIRNVAL